MLRTLVLATLSCLSISGVATATCPAFTTLTNGSAADANQVMNNFNYILQCPNFTGNVTISAGNAATLDVGLGGNISNTVTQLYGSAATIAPNAASLTTNGAVAWNFYNNGSSPSWSGTLLEYAGTSYPGSLNGLSAANQGLLVFQNVNNAVVASNGADIYVAPASVPSAVFKAGGNVGIGTVSPLGPLDLGPANGVKELVYGGGGNLSYLMGFGVNLGQAANSMSFFVGGAAGSCCGAANFAIESANQSSWPYTSYTTRFVLNSQTGDVGIGTVTPSYTLHVNGSVAGTSAYNNLSDARLKKDVAPIDNALATIEKLRGVHFRWRTPEERIVGKSFNLPVAQPQIGFVAQELKTVLPEAVTAAGGSEGILSVQESKVVPVLVEAVKQLKAANDNYAAQIGKLTALNDKYADRLKALEATNSRSAEAMASIEQRIADLQRKANVQTAEMAP